MEITYKILKMYYRKTDGEILSVDWLATGIEDDYQSAVSYSTKLESTADSFTFLPYETLTEEVVLDWIKELVDIKDLENKFKADKQAKSEVVLAADVFPWTVATVNEPAALAWPVTSAAVQDNLLVQEEIVVVNNQSIDVAVQEEIVVVNEPAAQEIVVDENIQTAI
jgi:hypothetical protein